MRPRLLVALLVLWAIPASAAGNPKPFVVHEISHALSEPLREIAKTAGPPLFRGWIEKEEDGSVNKVTRMVDEPDSVIQDDSEFTQALPITVQFNFDGMNGVHAGGAIPPDTNGAVGDKQFVLITNFAYSVYDKSTGKKTLGPIDIRNIWKKIGGTCWTFDIGDPIVLYDRLAKRWFIYELFGCIAVSATDDATGRFHLYSIPLPGTPDYPKAGVWPNAYFLSQVNFVNGVPEGQACALDRAAMLAGSEALMVCMPPNPEDGTLLPADFDGGQLPPAGAPNHYVELGNSNTTLNEYDFHVDFVNPERSTFKGPNIISVPAYTQLCGGGRGACIPQPNGGDLLDAIGDRLMYRNAYRNFGTHEALVFSHSVAPGKSSAAVAAVRWYELRSRSFGGEFFLYQAGTYQNKTKNYWMSSVAMDKAGDIAMGFSADDSTSLAPSIYLTGRVPSDPLNKMESTRLVVKGKNVQIGSNRWGDYSSLSVDPSDDCTLWYVQEYGKNGGENWQSRLVSFRFDRCK